MGWFYSVSERVVSVNIGKGEVVAVRPYSHVFIDPSSEGNHSVKSLVQRGVLQRSGSPDKKNAKKFVPEVPVAEIAIEAKSQFAGSIIEGAKAKRPVSVTDEPSSVEVVPVVVSTPETRALAASVDAESGETQKTGRRRRLAE